MKNTVAGCLLLVAGSFLGLLATSNCRLATALAEESPQATADPRVSRAMWVWKVDPIRDPQVREELLDFCRQAGVQTIYLYQKIYPVSKTPLESQELLSGFLREAHRAGISVHALQGDPRWALRPSHPLVLGWVQGYLEFNRGLPPEERIDGVQLDIEPYGMPGWDNNKERLKTEFLELLAQCRRLIDQESSGVSLQLGVAIPVFYQKEPEFEEALVGYADYAALMDYFDSPSTLIDRGRFHVELATRLKKKVVVGVETQDLVQMGLGSRQNTYHEEGWEEMERHLAQVVDAFSQDSGFGGVAVHAYDSYRILQKERRVPTRTRSGKVPGLVASQATHPILIDGELSDWSDGHWVRIGERPQVVYGPQSWTGPEDLSFEVAFQWEPEALLVAVDVTDNALIQESRAADMWEGDHVEVWLDADLEGDFEEAANSSDDFQFGFSPGNFNGLKPEVHVWVPSVDSESLGLIEVAAVQKRFGYIIEARIPVRVFSQVLVRQNESDSPLFKPGFRLGIMVDGSDTDDRQHAQKCMLSTSPERTWGDPTTFNILELR